MRDPATVTDASVVCSSGLKYSIFADGDLPATVSLPLGAASSANAVEAANIAQSVKIQRLFMKSSRCSQPTSAWMGGLIGRGCAVPASSATPAAANEGVRAVRPESGPVREPVSCAGELDG